MRSDWFRSRRFRSLKGDLGPETEITKSLFRPRLSVFRLPRILCRYHHFSDPCQPANAARCEFLRSQIYRFGMMSGVKFHELGQPLPVGKPLRFMNRQSQASSIKTYFVAIAHFKSKNYFQRFRHRENFQISKPVFEDCVKNGIMEATGFERDTNYSKKTRHGRLIEEQGRWTADAIGFSTLSNERIKRVEMKLLFSLQEWNQLKLHFQHHHPQNLYGEQNLPSTTEFGKYLPRQKLPATHGIWENGSKW